MQSLKKLLMIATLAFGVSTGVHAQEWGEFAYISSTMGVSDGRICTGEASRGAIGCATNAPYVSRATGALGVGTNSPTGLFSVENTTASARNWISFNNNVGVTNPLKTSGGFFFGYNRSNGAGEISLINSKLFGLNGGFTFGDYSDANVYTENLHITSSSLVGIGLPRPNAWSVSIPSSSLHVNGSVRLGAESLTSLQSCDANRTGTIKYQSGNFYICKNTALGWEPVSTSTSSTTPSIDTGLSGSIVFRDEYGYLKARGSFSISSTTGSVGIGAGAPGWLANNSLYVAGGIRADDSISLANDKSLTFGNGTTRIMGSDNEASNFLSLMVGDATAVRIVSTGLVGIGTTNPSGTLHVIAGTSNAPLVLNGNNRILQVTNYDSGQTAGLDLYTYGSSFFRINNSVSYLRQGSFGVGTVAPSTTLHVSGTLRIAAGTEACDTNRRGAIKYESSNFFVCRNGTTWETLVAGVGGTVDTDRITSGTTSVVANQNGSATVTIAGTPLVTFGNSGSVIIGNYANTDVYLDKAFNIVGNGGHSDDMNIVSYGDGVPNFGPLLQFARFRGTQLAPTGVLADDYLMELRGAASDGVYTGPAATIIGRAETDWVAGNNSSRNGYLSFFTRSSNVHAERMRITAAGYFGVGISQPSATIHSRGSIRLGTETSATLNVCDTNRTGAIKYESGDFFLCRNGTAWESLTGLTDGSTAASDRITSGTTSVIAANTGYVAYNAPISMTLPISNTTRPFDIFVQPGSDTGDDIRINSYSDNFGGGFHINRYRGTMAVPTSVQAGDYIATFTSNAYTGSGNRVGAGIYFQADETYGTSTGASSIVFAPVRSGNTARTEYMRLTGAGNLGLSTATPSTTLHVIGSIRMATEVSATQQLCDTNRTGAIKYQSGDFYVCRNGTAWESLSDVANGAASLADRITSGTTQVITRQNTSITLATAGIERVVVGTSGNVGIGQQPFDSTAYGRHLSVYNNISASTASANAGLSIQSTNRNATLHMIAGSTGASLIYFRRDSIDSTEGQGAITYSNANNSMLFRASATDVMTIAGNGSVGIGTPSPTTPLHVMGGMSIESISSDNNGAGLGFLKSRNGGAMLKDDRIMGLYGNGHNGSAYGGNVVAIETLAAEDFTPTAQGTWIRMGTTARGATSRVGNRWVLSPDGLMGISLPNVEPSATIHIRGSIRLGTETSATLNVCNTNRTGAIKYESGDFFYCRNGTAWESLTSLTSGGGSAADRITSGTTQVITKNNTSVSIVTAGVERVVVGTTGNIGIGQQPVTGVALATSGTGSFSSNLTVTGNNAVDATNGFVLRLGSNPDISFLDNSKGGADMYFDGHGYISSQYSTYSNISVSQSTPTGGAFVWGAFRPVRTGGTELMRLTDSGELGIGTASPSSSLHVSNDRAADTAILITNKSNDPLASAYFGANADIASFQLRANNSQASSTAQLGLPSGVVLFTNSGATGGITLSARNAAAPINFVAGNAQRMRLAANGYLGIGTDNPSRSLHVVGGEIQTSSSGDVCNTDRAGAIRYSGGNLSYCNGTAWNTLDAAGGTVSDRITSGTTQVITRNNTSVSIITANTERVVVGTNGTVGIGQQPVATNALSVSGTGAFSTNLTVGDPSVAATSLIALNTATGISASLRFAQTVDANFIQSGEGTSIGSAKDLRFSAYRTSTPWMTIAANGNVGVGTASPTHQLTVTGATQSGDLFSVGDPYGSMTIGNSTGTANLYAPTLSGNVVGPTRFTVLQSFITPTDDTGSVPAMVIRSRAGSATIVNRPILRIDNYTTPLVTVAASGFVGISTTTPSQTLTVDGILSVTNPGSTPKGSSLSFTSPQSNVGLAYVLGNGTGGTAGRWVTGIDPFNVFYIQRGNLFNSTGVRHLDITPDGRIGMGTAESSGAGTSSVPSTTLHVVGSIRMAAEISATYATCNINRTGAMKYESGDFFYCRNGTAWESLTSLTSGGGSASDRIISGTTQVITRNNTSVSIVTAGVERMIIGANGSVGIGAQPTGDFVTIKQDMADTRGLSIENLSTDTNAAARLSIASDAAALAITARSVAFNNTAPFNQYGRAAGVGIWTSTASTGGLTLAARNASGAIYFHSGGSSERMRIDSAGNVGISTTNPTAKLEVVGRVSATTVQLSNNPADACTPADYGTMKMINGRPYVCRP